MSDLCNQVEQFGKGIGSVPRYRIIESLFRGPKTVGEISKHTKLSQPLVSQHLKVLKDTGLVMDERQGKEVWYALDSKHTVELLKKLVEELSKNKK